MVSTVSPGRRLACLRSIALSGVVTGVLLASSAARAELTREQKLSDFQTLTALYDKQYGPYDWKKAAFGVDALDTRKWIQQVQTSRSDLEFYDICVRYVASLRDSHDEFTLPSFYEAYIPLTVDFYDGRILIDAIDPSLASYPFRVGDELVSVDGRSVSSWIEALRPYAVNAQANPVSRDRIAVATILDRYQGWYTWANQVQPGDVATLVIRRQSGALETYSIPWSTIGIPLDEVGPVPNNGRRYNFRRPEGQNPVKPSIRESARSIENPWGIWTGDRAPEAEVKPAGAERRERLVQASAVLPAAPVAGSIVPFNSFFPKFVPPPGFVLRRGALSTDEIVSGTFLAGGKKFGFIRIPSFSPGSASRAVSQFAQEIAFFKINTSGLVIDLMDNGGGSLCYANNLVQYLAPAGFDPIPFKVRATEGWILNFESSLLNAVFGGASRLTIDTLAGFLTATQSALAQSRGNTDPIPYVSPALCSLSGGSFYPPATSAGINLAYTGPIVVLTSSFTLSAAETFSATLQDLGRATIYGVGTDGGGGNVVGYDDVLGPFSFGSTRVTQTIEVRSKSYSAPGLPTAPFIENIGVQPDVTADFQTKANLLSGGVPFVQGFTALITQLAGP